MARLPVCAGGKGNGGKARHQVNFNHASVDDDENHDIQSRHGKLHEERLQENTEERPQFHGFKLGLHIIQYIRRDGGGALYQARRLLDDLLGYKAYPRSPQVRWPSGGGGPTRFHTRRPHGDGR